MSTDFWIDCVMWPIVIGANILAYYYDLYYHDEHHQLKNTED